MFQDDSASIVLPKSVFFFFRMKHFSVQNQKKQISDLKLPIKDDFLNCMILKQWNINNLGAKFTCFQCVIFNSLYQFCIQWKSKQYLCLLEKHSTNFFCLQIKLRVECMGTIQLCVPPSVNYYFGHYRLSFLTNNRYSRNRQIASY